MRSRSERRRDTPCDSADSFALRFSWSKSKVYIHPTAYAKNNVAGWLAISQVSDSADNYLLSWLPEALVEEGEDYENYVFVETAESGSTYSKSSTAHVKTLHEC